MPSSRPSFLALLAAAALVAPAAAAPPVTRNLRLMSHHDQYPPTPGAPFGAGYASCWSYIHADGREYAVIGATRGTAIYNVTDPALSYRVAFIPGPTSSWREMKSYRSWIYIVTEGVGGGDLPPSGIQIIRMTNPEAPVHVATYAGPFYRSHTVSVDTARAILVCNGTTAGSGEHAGMRILSLANPEAPVEIGRWPNVPLPIGWQEYVHDSAPLGDRLYASSIYSGIQRIFDFSNPAAPVEIAAWTYPGAFTHNAWPDATGSWLYATDEVGGEPLKVFDISDPGAPRLVNTFTANPQAIVHNAYVHGDELYLAHYTEGVRILDISDPAHPAEFAFGDSYPGTSGGYFGVWNVCPYFPSGTVIASDMQTGLYVYRPVRDYGIVRVRVVNAATAAPLANVMVRLDGGTDSLATPADGIVRFACAPGARTVAVRPFGYEPASAGFTVSVGSRDSVTLALVEKPTADLEGVVRDAASLGPLASADVRLAYTPVHEHTEAAGTFLLRAVPDDFYRVEVRRPGYVPIVHERRIGPGHAGYAEYHLNRAAAWDDLEADRGWTVGAPGDEATGGIWTRVDPVGSGSLPPGTGRLLAPRAAPERGDGGRPPRPLHDGPPAAGRPEKVQPEDDRTPPPGVMCFVTGQGTYPPDVDEADVDDGRTSLTTPDLDVSGMAAPAIGYWRWFYSNGDASDWLAVLVSSDGGATWAAVDTTRGRHNHWEERTIRLADHVAPGDRVRVRFVAADLGPPSIVEAAIDDLVIYDAPAPAVGLPAGGPPARLAFRPPSPNPSAAGVGLALAVPRAGRVEAEVLDVTGRRVRGLHRGPAPAGILPLAWDGTDEAGRPAPAGLYFARARAGAQQAVARFVRLP